MMGQKSWERGVSKILSFLAFIKWALSSSDDAYFESVKIIDFPFLHAKEISIACKFFIII